MASFVDMSLEDIIKKKRKENPRSKGPIKQAPPKKSHAMKQQGQAAKLPITDARNKIISRNRKQITDARDKLAELAKKKDARLKLEQMRRNRQSGQVFNQPQGRNTFKGNRMLARTFANKERVFIDASRHVVSQPLSAKSAARRQINTKRFLENRSISQKNQGKSSMSAPKPIRRTVENDLIVIDDPMEDDYIAPKVNLLNRKASLQLKIVAHNNEPRLGRSSVAYRSAASERERSPPRPPSILKKRPIAALRTENKTEQNEKPVLEYRIIVSNLRSSVTGSDIQELFGDVGGMKESRLVRPGTAEVIYGSQEDAQRAVDLYHNRQLDGQPMNCLLVTPRASPAARSSSSKPALVSSNSNVEPDISTFHKVLFSNF